MRELTRSELYTDFLRTYDIPHFLATWLHKAPDKLVALTFHGSHRRGAFGREETERLVPLLPHISRALEIRDRLETHRFRADTLVGAADRLTFGILILDAMGRILDANVMAQTLLGDRGSIWRTTDGTLCLAGPPGQLFRQWIRDGAPARGAVDGMLHVVRPDGRLPVSVLPTPVSGPMIGWISSAPRWLVLLFDPEHRVLPSADLVARDLGITGREAQVATHLSLGLSLRQVSERLGVSIHTVRAQIKSIYAKTGMNSQAQIVRRIVTGLGALSDATTSPAGTMRGIDPA
jgi:DNA-binding CsgD family transcriptional regulator